jgi:hypothetical protein
MRMSLPSLKPASSPQWNIWRTFSALQPHRWASVSGLYGRGGKQHLLFWSLLAVAVSKFQFLEGK